MHNVVSFQPDRPRPPRPVDLPRGGARILFFTGVRYCRDEAAPPAAAPVAYRLDGSGRALDAAAH